MGSAKLACVLSASSLLLPGVSSHLSYPFTLQCPPDGPQTLVRSLLLPAAHVILLRSEGVCPRKHMSRLARDGLSHDG